MGLCLPRKGRENSRATSPRTLSVASITNHSCTTSAGLALIVDMGFASRRWWRSLPTAGATLVGKPRGGNRSSLRDQKNAAKPAIVRDSSAAGANQPPTNRAVSPSGPCRAVRAHTAPAPWAGSARARVCAQAPPGGVGGGVGDAGGPGGGGGKEGGAAALGARGLAHFAPQTDGSRRLEAAACGQFQPHQIGLTLVRTAVLQR